MPVKRLRRPARRAGRRAKLPSSIGRYRVVRKIGEGGMGTVFEAFDEVLGRRIAIKRLKAVDESARRRFWREARAVARLSHPNVCQLYEVGEDGSGPFLAMELLAGEPLSARLRRAPMSAAEVVALGAGILAALQAIHAAGLIHRDIKPSNVHLTPYGPRLLDFGLARALPEVARARRSKRDARGRVPSRSPITDARLMIGTPRYMAPEQILGGVVDGRADLFATAAVLYEAVTGKHAIPGSRLVEVLSATIHSPPAPLPASLARLDAVLRRALAKTPSERYAGAQEMAEALHAAAAAPPVAAPAVEAENGAIFVGRVAELASLQERLDAAIAGAGGIVFVTGERGVGKSAIVGEMLRRVRASSQKITVVTGRCLEHQGPGEALQPFLDALGRLFGTSQGRAYAVELVKTFAPTAAVLMPAALVPDPDGSLQRQTAGATRERLIRESGDFMEAATRLYPLVILLEDLQWADAVSVDLLSHLGRRAGRQRILILGTCRPSEVEDTNPLLHRAMVYLRTAGLGHELELGPLDAADVQQWLERRFPGNDFAAGLAPPLHARADGLPLFVRGLVELLAGRRDIERRADGFRLARPQAKLDLEPSKDIKDLVRAHLATLPGTERELLAVASVLGKEFSSAIARGLARGDAFELEERLQRLARVHRVLEGQGDEELPDGALGTRYRFAHGLYQRVLYEDLVAPRRAELHRRAGELLLRHLGENAPTRAVEMAEHFERGRDVARAARFRTLAGEHAVRRFSGAEAVEHYSTAIRLVEKLPESQAQPLEAALYGRRAAARVLLAQFDAAARDYEAMLEWARAGKLAAAECEALSGLCNAHFFEQRLEPMTLRAREALAAAERLGSPHHLAEARGRVAQALVLEGRLGEACTALDAVVAACSSERLARRAPARADLPRLRALLARRVPGGRGPDGRGPRAVRRARRRLRRALCPNVPGRVPGEPGAHVGGARRPGARAGLRPPQWRPLLAAAPRQPDGLGAPRARRGGQGPRARRARARARTREPVSLGPRSRRSPQPVRRRRACRRSRGRRGGARDPRRRHRTQRLAALDERPAPRDGGDRAPRRARLARPGAGARQPAFAGRGAGRGAQLRLHRRAAHGRGHAGRSRRPARGGRPARARARGARSVPRTARDLEVAARAGVAQARAR